MKKQPCSQPLYPNRTTGSIWTQNASLFPSQQFYGVARDPDKLTNCTPPTWMAILSYIFLNDHFLQCGENLRYFIFSSFQVSLNSWKSSPYILIYQHYIEVTKPTYKLRLSLNQNDVTFSKMSFCFIEFFLECTFYRFFKRNYCKQWWKKFWDALLFRLI